MAEKVFLNDKLVDKEKAAIPANDTGFLYGAGLFETMRAHKGVVFCLKDHLDRLFFSAKTLGIDHSYSKRYITDAIYDLLEADNLSEARLRLTLSAGPMRRAGERPCPTLLITASRFKAYPPELYEKGALAVLCPFRQNPAEPVAGHKSTSYFSRLLALQIARQKQAAEALWFTPENHLAEGCISNVFLVKDSRVLTPPIRTPVLAGVARKNIFRLAGKNSVKITEKDLYIEDLLGADEVFISNVIMQVLPVTRIEKHKVGEGNIGRITEKIKHYFGEFLEKVCSKRK